MAKDGGFREELVKPHEKELKLLVLGLCAGVLGIALGVKTALVTDADGTAVDGTAVGSDVENAATLYHLAALADVEVIADGAELAGLVVAQELLLAIVLVLARGGTVEDYEADGVRRLHLRTVLIVGQERLL